MKTMYRTVFTPTETDSMIPFSIPCEWSGRDIEFIVFPLDMSQTIMGETVKKSESKFREIPARYLFDTKNFKFNRDEANDYE
jgi:hypothetical protein